MAMNIDDEPHYHLLDLPLPCLKCVVSFAATKDLCALDATRVAPSMPSPAPFGPERGDGCLWHGTDEGEEARKRCLEEGGRRWRPPGEVSFPKIGAPRGADQRDCPHLLQPQHSFVCLSDGWDNVEGGNWDGNKAIVVRDARTLQQKAILDENTEFWFKTAIAGTAGREVIGLTSPGAFGILQGRHFEMVDFNQIEQDRVRLSTKNGDGLPILGSKNHFVLYRGGKLYVFKFQGSLLLSQANPISLVTSAAVIPREEVSESTSDWCYGMSWASSEEQPGTFAFSCLPGQISVWHLDDQTSKLKQVQMVSTEDVDVEEVYITVAVGERFVVGSPVDTTAIHLFDRKSGGLLGELSEAVDEISCAMQIIGDLLITTPADGSHGLCVWQLQTKSLLCRYEH